MKKDYDIETILSGLSVRPCEQAKKAAYERMMARSSELLAAEAKAKKDGGLVNRKLDPEELTMAAAGTTDPNDNYDPVRCQFPSTQFICRVKNPAERCKHLKIEKVSADGERLEKYRYICEKGCFDYVSGIKLH